MCEIHVAARSLCQLLIFLDYINQYSITLWSVITVKNKCLIMISTISVITLRYAIVLFQCDVLIFYLVLVLSHLTILLLQSADLSLYLGDRLFCYCILVFFHFDTGKSRFAVVICHLHSAFHYGVLLR